MIEQKDAIGVVCEYDPFHEGHASQLRLIRQVYPEHPLCMVMSGNYVQRACPAVADKFTRARAAVASGADLVLELPFPYSTLSAQGYAQSALSVLRSLSCVGVLAFGASVLDESLARRCAEVLASSSFEASFSARLALHPEEAYAYAREQTLLKLVPGARAALREPNDILALEYCLALLKDPDAPELFFTPREAGHSASALRGRLAQGEDILPFLPEEAAAEYRAAREAGHFPVRTDRFETLLLCEMRAGRSCPMLGGLGARVSKAALLARDYAEFVERTKTRGVTRARVRRGVLHAYFGVPETVEPRVPYTQVLCANERGRALLARLRRTAQLPIYTKPAQALHTKEEAVQKAAALCARADSVYAALMGETGDWFVRQSLIVNKL